MPGCVTALSSLRSPFLVSIQTGTFQGQAHRLATRPVSRGMYARNTGNGAFFRWHIAEDALWTVRNTLKQPCSPVSLLFGVSPSRTAGSDADAWVRPS